MWSEGPSHYSQALELDPTSFLDQAPENQPLPILLRPFKHAFHHISIRESQHSQEGSWGKVLMLSSTGSCCVKVT